MKCTWEFYRIEDTGKQQHENFSERILKKYIEQNSYQNSK